MVRRCLQLLVQDLYAGHSIIRISAHDGPTSNHPARIDRSVPTDGQADSLNLVAVVSESPHEAIGRLASTVSVRLQGFANDSRVRYTRVAAHTVGGSAARLLRRTGKTGVCATTAGLFGMAPGDLSDLPRDVPAIMNLLLAKKKVSGTEKRLSCINVPEIGS